jgi:hypothetical protein
VTDEPVRRYLDHVIPHGAPLHSGALLAMWVPQTLTILTAELIG